MKNTSKYVGLQYEISDGYFQSWLIKTIQNWATN